MTKTWPWLIAAALPVVRDCPDTPSDRAADGHDHNADQRDGKRFDDQHHDFGSVSHAQKGVSKKSFVTKEEYASPYKPVCIDGRSRISPSAHFLFMIPAPLAQAVRVLYH